MQYSQSYWLPGLGCQSIKNDSNVPYVLDLGLGCRGRVNFVGTQELHRFKFKDEILSSHALDFLKNKGSPQSMIDRLQRPEIPEVKPNLPDPEWLIFEKKPENKLVVGKNLLNPHPMVLKLGKSLKEAKENEKHILLPRLKKSLDVSVTKLCIPRVLRVLDAFIKGIASRGLKINVDYKDKRITSAPRRMQGESS